MRPNYEHFSSDLGKLAIELETQPYLAAGAFDQLRAENKRLREALERIAGYDAPDAHAMILQARAALKSTNQD